MISRAIRAANLMWAALCKRSCSAVSCAHWGSTPRVGATYDGAHRRGWNSRAARQRRADESRGDGVRFNDVASRFARSIRPRDGRGAVVIRFDICMHGRIQTRTHTSFISNSIRQASWVREKRHGACVQNCCGRKGCGPAVTGSFQAQLAGRATDAGDIGWVHDRGRAVG